MKLPRRMPIAALLAFVCCAAVARAQIVVQSSSGPPNVYYGHAVCIVGDVDGDGYADFAVGSDYDDTAGANAGKVEVRSGKTGALLHTILGALADDRFGSQLAAVGDVNGDGVPDFVAGAAFADSPTLFNCGSVTMVSGATGAKLYTRFGDKATDILGWAVAAIGDVNADGVGDFAAGSYAADGGAHFSGVVRVYSGANGATLKTIAGAAASVELGISLAGVGDVDGDGVTDVAFGDADQTSSPFNAGHATIVSSAGWSTIHTLAGTVASQQLGRAVAAAGDMNGDGKADVAVASTGWTVSFNTVGKVEVVSGADKSILATALGDGSHTFLGECMAGGADLNGDGRPDFAASVRTSPGFTAARVFSGVDGNVLTTINGSASDDNFGFALSVSGDVSGDGLADLAVGAGPHYAAGGAGSARVYAIAPKGLAFYGAGTPGCDGAEILASPKSAKVGDPAFPLVCDRAPASSLGLGLVGNVQSVAGNDPLALGVLFHVDLFASTLLQGVNVPSDAKGFGHVALFIPNLPGLVGQTLDAQVIWSWGGNPCFPSPLGLSSSNGLAITFQP